jgi:hypothetical protein
MQEDVRDDALYCSARCKLKAQRRRKKERAQRELDEARPFEPVVPFRNPEQLSFFFMHTESAPAQSVPEATNSELPVAPTETVPPLQEVVTTPSKKAPARSWFDGLRDALKGKPSDGKPRHRPRVRATDIV